MIARIAGILLLSLVLAPAVPAGDIMVRSNPEKFRVEVKYAVAFGGGSPDQFILALPLPEKNEYQDIWLPGDLPGRTREFTETGGKFLHVRFRRADVGVKRRFAVDYFFNATLYDIAADLSRITEIFPYTRDSHRYRRYTAPAGTYVLPNHREIVRLRDELGESSEDHLDYARRAYEYVADSYRLQASGPWLSRLESVLGRQSGGEGDLVSVYVSLLRSRGIPARHVAGVDVNGKRRVFAEFFLEYYGWIPVDVANRARRPDDDFFGVIRREDAVAVLSRDVNMSVDNKYWDVLDSHPEEETVDTMLRGHVWYYTGAPRHFGAGPDGQPLQYSRGNTLEVSSEVTNFTVTKARE